VWVLVNHFKSKREDSSTQAYTLPRRLQQAQFVAGLVSEIYAAHPGAAVIVLGDLNDYPNAQPLAIVRQAGLWNAMESVARGSRYTYIYQGVSQVMDHVLVSSALAINCVAAQPAHLNADYPYIYRGQNGHCLSGIRSRSGRGAVPHPAQPDLFAIGCALKTFGSC
jgi:predicted extracellular nuclease